jgi:hypothetical protein
MKNVVLLDTSASKQQGKQHHSKKTKVRIQNNVSVAQFGNFVITVCHLMMV